MPAKKTAKNMTVGQLKERKNELLEELRHIYEALSEVVGMQQEIGQVLNPPSISAPYNPAAIPPAAPSDPSAIEGMESYVMPNATTIDPYQSEEYLESLRQKVKEQLDEDKASRD